MSRNRGKFITLEGIDGAGKSSLTEKIATRRYVEMNENALRDASVDRKSLVHVARRDICRSSNFSANLMRLNAEMLWNSGDQRDLSDRFWVTLQASWFTAQSDAVIRPLLEAGHDVVVDGWMYKFWSKVVHQGYSISDLEIIFQGALVPDLVLLLCPDVGAVFDRGRKFRPTELGMHVGYERLNRDTFVEYQTRGFQSLQDMSVKWDWTELHVPNSESLDRTAERARRLLDDAGVYVGGFDDR